MKVKIKVKMTRQMLWVYFKLLLMRAVSVKVIRIGKLNEKAEIRKRSLVVVTNSIAEKKKILNNKWKVKEAGTSSHMLKLISR